MKNSIWFDKPTRDWEEGLPIGNGRLGAMILGNVVEDQIYLNEESIWYGGHKDRHNPDALKHLDEVRGLLFEGEIEKAEMLCKMSLGSSPQYINPYMPGGYLWMFWPKQHTNYEHYTRSLALNEAIVKVQYDVENVTYTREYLSSSPDQVMAIHLSANEEKKLSFHMNINRRPYDGETKAIDDETILMTCECGRDGVEFATAIKAEVKDGMISTVGNYLVIEEASEVTFYIATQTTYREGNLVDKVLQQVQNAKLKGYEKIKQEHIQDYQKLFKHSSITLNPKEEENPIPTDRLLEACKAGQDSAQLVELFYNFGKYLLIASSRKGGLPANLQGIWNMSYTPAWESNYTININTQMNYWPAEVNNLSECHEPLFEFIERLCENGKHTAKVLYGCRGSVAHHVSNIWADSEPGGIYAASPYWPMGLAWLSLHMYEHYLYTGDKDFLRNRCYPVLEEVAAFYSDYLVASPDGYLVTGPTVSPENLYVSPKGEVGALCMGASMDSQIIREVFEGFKTCLEVLEIENSLKEEIERVESKLPPIRVGKQGQIMEWYQELEEVEPGHRHVSHLFALHPGNQITEATSELFKGADVTLKKRLENGGGHTGWSKAWIINFYARLLQGEEAYNNLLGLLQKSVRISLLDVHPPFQIDGNFGACAGIAEMLMQSHEGWIRLLPACPKAWHTGKVQGLCARGGFEVDFAWERGKVKAISIYSKNEHQLSVKTECEVKQVLNQSGESVPFTLEGDILSIQTKSKEKYRII